MMVGSSKLKSEPNEKAIMEKEMNLKRKLIEATDAVRKKFNSLKTVGVQNKLALEKIYDPIATPLKHISSMAEELMNKTQTSTTATSGRKKRSSSSSSSTSNRTTSTVRNLSTAADYDDDKIMQTGMETPPLSSPSSITPSETSSPTSPSSSQNLAQVHLTHLKSDKGKYIYDTVYGIRINPIDRRKMLMGNVEVRFTDDDITLFRGNNKLASYHISEELLELLFLKKPSAALRGDISEPEREAYADILRLTNAAYNNYNVRAGINARRMMKYTRIIKPIMENEEWESMTGAASPRHTRSKYSGKGGATKVFNGDRTSIDYIYWNKPQELIERLRLLWSSKMAGHSGHDNEIISILEELDEEGLIM